MFVSLCCVDVLPSRIQHDGRYIWIRENKTQKKKQFSDKTQKIIQSVI